MTKTSEDSVSRADCLDEPLLEFGSGQRATDPHDGLGLYGPYSIDTPSHPQSPSYALIAPQEGIASFTDWSRAMNRGWAFADAKKHRIWAPYPGYEVAFGTRWSEKPTATLTLDRAALLEASRKRDPHERCVAVVNHFMDAFEKLQKLDAKLSVAICVIPDEVWVNCRPESRVQNPSDKPISHERRRARRQGQADLFLDDLGHFQYSPDFRRQLKARAMQFDVPIQLIRESTLRLTDKKEHGQRGLTALSDRFWNLGTAIYYKAGGKPWKLSTARDGVCYIGIAFRRGDGPQTACCAAQMFLDSGDGVVFLGEYGPWYSPETHQFHLSPQAARSLLDGVLKTYAQLEGKPLKEVFLHCRSQLSDEEFAGFRAACPPGCKLVGVRVRNDPSGPRLYRDGTRPVLRGTFLKLWERGALLYASGFKPHLATYDGWETPVPLRIDILHGDADIDQVARDILGLTKLNYNACKLGDSEPVTVKFSDAVGEILVSNPTVKHRRPNFKFYI